MKHGKRPTRNQKIFLKEKGLNFNNWLIVKDCKEVFIIVNKLSGKIRTFNKL